MINNILFFFMYGFLGYLCEVIYCSILEKRIVNRGFLFGPICPIYGFCAILILLPLYQIRYLYYLILPLGFLITSFVEYMTSFLLEKLFGLSFWDYSNYKFNLHGRVCLLNSTLFTILVVLMMYLVHPYFIIFLNNFNFEFKKILSIVLVIIYFFDTLTSFILTNNIITKIKVLKEEIDAFYSGEFNRYLLVKLLSKFPKLKNITNKKYLNQLKITIPPKKK